MILEKEILIPFWAEFFPEISCGFTLPPFGNMALTRESITKKNTTVENRKELLRFLGFNEEKAFYPHLIHSDIVLNATEQEAGKGFISLENAIEADACITDKKDILLAITWADCIPALLYEHTSGWLGAVHSGWKGTLKNITGKTIRLLLAAGAKIENLYAAVGPGIKDCCYEVGYDFVLKFENTLLKKFIINKNGKFFYNLSDAVIFQLREAGVKKENIDYYGKCTCCSKDPSFFSCRKDKNLFEAQAAFIGKKSYA